MISCLYFKIHQTVPALSFVWTIHGDLVYMSTAGNMEKGVKQGKSSYLLLSMKKDQANKTNVERVQYLTTQ